MRYFGEFPAHFGALTTFGQSKLVLSNHRNALIPEINSKLQDFCQILNLTALTVKELSFELIIISRLEEVVDATPTVIPGVV